MLAIRLKSLLVISILVIPSLAFSAQRDEGNLTSEQIKLSRSVSKAVLGARVKERHRVKREVHDLKIHLKDIESGMGAISASQNIPELPSMEILPAGTESGEPKNKKGRQQDELALSRAKEDQKRRALDASRVSSVKRSIQESKRELKALKKAAASKDKRIYERLALRLEALSSEISEYENETDIAEKRKKIRSMSSRFSEAASSVPELNGAPFGDVAPTFSTITKHK